MGLDYHCYQQHGEITRCNNTRSKNSLRLVSKQISSFLKIKINDLFSPRFKSLLLFCMVLHIIWMKKYYLINPTYFRSVSMKILNEISVDVSHASYNGLKNIYITPSKTLRTDNSLKGHIVNNLNYHLFIFEASFFVCLLIWL